jgi:predicted lysophospholipase L1 biosynthesis ABC-type transport system permease subunit
MSTLPAPWTIDKLPLRPGLVVSLALTSLRLRWGRTVLTLLTIATSTAFLMYLLNTPRATDDVAEFEAWGLMLALSLLVSIAGVLNTMLMSVTQRYREIGTMKCLGALDQFVLYSVLLEAAILGFCGAAGGVIAGLVLSFLLGLLEFGAEFWSLWKPSMLPFGILVSFLAGTSLTTLGALIPAWIASKMPPMDAMRGEK